MAKGIRSTEIYAWTDEMMTRLLKTARLWSLLFIMAWSILASVDAHAESATRLLQQAEEAFSVARFQQAIRLLHRAKIKTRVEQADATLLGRIHFQLGLNYAVLEQTKGARKAFREALQCDPELRPDPALLKPSITQLFAEARESLRGTLVVSADQPGAVVLVDGKERGGVPLTLSLPVGPYEIVLVIGGERTKSRRVVITAGQTLALGPQHTGVRPTLKKQPLPPTDPFSKDGGARVQDDVRVSATPAAQRLHRVWPRTLGFILVGAGAVSLISGAVLGGVVSSKKGEYEDRLRNGEPYLELTGVLDSARDYEKAEYATLIVGGILAAAGAGLLLWSFLTVDDHQSPSRATLTPVLGQRLCGILGEFRF